MSKSVEKEVYNAISSCRVYDFNTVESRLNFVAGYLESSGFTFLATLLNYCFYGSTEIPF